MTPRPAELLTRYSSGEAEAARELCAAYLPVIEGLALAGTLSLEGAGEVVRAAARDVMSRLAEVESASTMLQTVEDSTRRKLAEWLQSGKSKSSEIVAIPPEVAERAKGQGLDLGAVFGEVPGERSAWMLLEAASWLPAKYQTPFLLRYLSGKSYREIAELSGSDSEQVASEIEAARRLYERELAFYLKKQEQK